MVKRRNQEIRNILTVLGAAVICAGLLVSLFLYYYGPSGRYLADKTLLDSATIERMRYQDEHPQTGTKVYFTFDHIEFSYFDTQKQLMRKNAISLQKYQEFYKKVASDKSLEIITKEVQNQFSKPHLFILTISMRTIEKGGNPAIKNFQVVQMTSEDYFRVQLHQKSHEDWAYFYHPGLHQELISLFVESSSK